MIRVIILYTPGRCSDLKILLRRVRLLSIHSELAQTGDRLVAIGMQWVVPDKVPYTLHIFPDTFMRGAVLSAGLICMAIAPRRIPNLLRVRATHFVIHA